MVSKPKILVLDIETAPAKGYFWRMFDENISLEQLIDPGRVICVAWKWHGKSEVFFGAEWTGPPDQFLRDVHAAMSEADAIVTFNGDKFDLPKLNGEFIKLKLKRPAPSASIDLRKTTKKFGYVSGKLQHVATVLKIGAKMKHEGFELWRKVLEGDPKAQAKMERYNRQDTRLTDRLYKEILPYITSHPYLHDTPKGACAACGSTHVQLRGTRRTKSFIIERLACVDCGSWSDGKRTKAK